MRWVATTLLALALAGPAAACINDSEVDRSEREFKSQYNQPAPEYKPAENQLGPPIALLGVGSALLVGACVVTLRPRRAP